MSGSELIAAAAEGKVCVRAKGTKKWASTDGRERGDHDAPHDE
jgi:hypothetical protein